MAPMNKTLAPRKGSIVTTRDPKGRKFIEIVEAAYNKAAMSEDEAQHVNEAQGLSDLVHKFIAENRLSDRFKDEEVKSSYGYLSGYKPKGITEQTNILRQLFHGIGFADEKLAEASLPQHAEGWFAIPKWQSMAPTYGEAVQKVLDMIKKTRDGNFVNYREGQLGLKRLRQTIKTVEIFEKFGDEQKDYDILVVPTQFGLRHRGRSTRRAREVFLTNEFGLGAFAVGIMLLTHPERLKHYDDLWIDCAGDEFDDPYAAVRFFHATCFEFHGDRVRFGAIWFADASAHYGSVSAFGPQR